MLNCSTPQRDAHYVNGKTIPVSLRHRNDISATEDALYLACFLQDATIALVNSGSGIGDNSQMGLDLCFDLLRDKLAIALGEIAFPLSDLKDNLPPLWTPLGKEGRGL